MLQFVAVGLLAAVVLSLATGWFSQRAARHEAIRDARATTALLARSVIEPGIPAGLVAGEPAALDRFDRLVRSRVLGGQVLRVKVWDVDGTIVFSDEPRLNGRRYDLGADELAILLGGGTAAEVSDLSEPRTSTTSISARWSRSTPRSRPPTASGSCSRCTSRPAR